MKAGKSLKVLLRIAVLLIVVLSILYYTGNRVKENNLLEAPVKQGTAVPVQNKGLGEVISHTSRPSKGLSTFVGGSAEELLKEKGKPDRIEPSGYGYDWWVYLEDEKFMAGVTDGSIVNQLYSAELTADVTPFEIGQDISDIYRFTIVESEINVEIGENTYTFSLNSEDLQTRLLIIYKGLYAQLYIDAINGKLEAIRFIDPTTLVLHQPYEMTFTGKLLVAQRPSSTVQQDVDRTAERQIFELTNSYRKKHGVQELRDNKILNKLGREHSEKLALEKYLSGDSLTSPSFADRLKVSMIEQRKAGENIASDYTDAIEAVHGWHNSPAHRKILLDEDFTHLGVGAYGNVYTQNFVLLIEEDIEERRK